MISIVLQFLIALFLVLCAIRLRRSTSAPPALTWSQIMGRFAVGNNHLAALSYGCVFSEGIESSPQELWERVGGPRGVLWIYKNVGVLLFAIDYLEMRNPNTPCLGETLDGLRREAAQIRLNAVTLLVRQAVRPVFGDSPALIRVAVGYSAIIAHLGLAIHDYAPELISGYIHPMSQV